MLRYPNTREGIRVNQHVFRFEIARQRSSALIGSIPSPPDPRKSLSNSLPRVLSPSSRVRNCSARIVFL